MNLNAIALRSIVVLVIGLIAAQAFRGRGAATRHLIYAATLVSLLLLPVIRRWAPVGFVGPRSVPAPIQHAVNAIPSLPTPSAIHVSDIVHPTSMNGGLLRATEIVFAAWALVALLMLGRLGLGLAQLVRIVRRSEKVTVPGFELHDIRLSIQVSVPSTAWVGRHVILLPATYLEWPEERLESVIFHELAHIQRRDWFLQMSGRVACALYWPNPLVWLAQRRMLDTAEQAADDSVLQKGVKPSQYAEDLLQIARSVKRSTAMAVPMAAKSDVGRRINMVLDSKKRRGSVTLPTVALVALGVAGVSIPAANVMLSDIQQDKTSPYEDIRNGKTISGCLEDNYTATLEDGRQVTLFQIGKHMPDGSFKVWRPNGSTLSAKDTFPAQYNGPEKGMTEFLFRVSSVKENFIGATGSGPVEPGEPTTQTFAGNWSLPKSKDGSVVVVSLMEIPEGNGDGTSSYSFTVTDGPVKAVAGWDVAIGDLWSLDTYATKVSFNPDVDAKVFHQPAIPDKAGNYAMDTVRSIEIGFQTSRGPWTETHRVVGYAAGGKPVDYATMGSDGYGHFNYDFAQSAKVQKIEVQTQRVRAVDFIGVHIQPNSWLNP